MNTEFLQSGGLIGWGDTFWGEGGFVFCVFWLQVVGVGPFRTSVVHYKKFNFLRVSGTSILFLRDDTVIMYYLDNG